MTLEDAYLVLSALRTEDTPRVSAFKLRLTQVIDGILKASKEPGESLDMQLQAMVTWLRMVGDDVEMPEVGTDLLAAAAILRAARDRAAQDALIYQQKVKDMTQAAIRMGAPHDTAPAFDPDQFGSSKGMRMAARARLQEVGFQVECAIRFAEFVAEGPRLTILRPPE